MDVPKSFRPKKDLEKHVKNLRFPKRKKIRSLKDLVLEFKSFGLIEHDELRTLKDYSYLNNGDVADGLSVEYGYDEPSVDILWFINKERLEYNFNSIINRAKRFNEASRFSEVHVLVKGAYAIFVYTMIGDYDKRTEIIDAYKKKFDFKEVKVG